jgi:hypothetical protein
MHCDDVSTVICGITVLNRMVALLCSFSVFPLFITAFYSQKYTQNYRTFKIQNLPESKKE